MDNGQARSGFVTGVGVSFLVLGIIALVLASLQLVLAFTFVDQDALRAGMQARHNVENVPGSVRYAFAHLRAISLWFFGGSLLLTVASAGLIKRRNWARWLFIALMILAIVGHLAPLFLGQGVAGWMSGMMANAPAGMHARAQAAMQAASIVYAVLAIGFSVLFAWIIWKLLSPPIAAEFRSR